MALAAAEAERPSVVAAERDALAGIARPRAEAARVDAHRGGQVGGSLAVVVLAAKFRNLLAFENIARRRRSGAANSLRAVRASLGAKPGSYRGRRRQIFFLWTRPRRRGRARFHHIAFLRPFPTQRRHHVAGRLGSRHRRSRFLCESWAWNSLSTRLIPSKGRAGIVALRRSKAGGKALGKAFYKGGFESRMTRREAALILQLKYVSGADAGSRADGVQRAHDHAREDTQEPPVANAAEPPGPRRIAL